MNRRSIDGALEALPAIPRDREGPVFAEPWHAQAFAMTVALNERGLIDWSVWADTLASEIRDGGHGEGEDGYYLAWLAALERLLDETGMVPADERRGREDAWDRAARATPHGEPIVLGRERTAT